MGHAGAEYEPRHSAGEPGSPHGDAVIARRAEQAPTVAAAELLRDIYRRQGTAFAAYLTLDGIDGYARTAESDFENAYVATYPDQQILIEDTIATFGWRQDLDRRLGCDPLLRSVVTFDHSRIWEFVNEGFDILESTEGLYVFDR